jgi:hypothetical protein
MNAQQQSDLDHPDTERGYLIDEGLLEKPSMARKGNTREPDSRELCFRRISTSLAHS